MMKDKLDFNEVALSLRVFRQELLAWQYGRVGCRENPIRGKRHPLRICAADGVRPLQRDAEAVQKLFSELK
jgi:hypothetical protein